MLDTISTIQEVSIMGGSIERAITKPFKRLNRDLIEKPFRAGKEAATDVRRGIEKPFRTGRTGAERKASKRVKQQTLLQQQRESIRLAEAEDEVAQRRGLASSKRGGRQSLIRSSGGGIVNTLGGV